MSDFRRAVAPLFVICQFFGLFPLFPLKKWPKFKYLDFIFAFLVAINLFGLWFVFQEIKVAAEESASVVAGMAIHLSSSFGTSYMILSVVISRVTKSGIHEIFERISRIDEKVIFLV